MKISFFEVGNDEEARFREEFANDEVKFFKESIQDVDISEYKDSDIISIFIYSKVFEEILEQMPNLKLVTTRSTGMDHINVEYCEAHNIAVKNVPLYGENTVAEHTFALLLAISRKIRISHARVNSGSFSSRGLQGVELRDKTIGIIGGGRIGMHVARMASAFDMYVKVYDLKRDEFLADIIAFKYASLDEIFETADVISLHLPYNESTHHILDNEAFNKMKDGVIIINTARGGLVDTNSLISAIESGKVSGAGLDVIEGEEFLLEENLYNSPIEEAAKLIIQSKKLLDNENIVFTPHNGFNSKEAENRIINKTIENIREMVRNN